MRLIALRALTISFAKMMQVSRSLFAAACLSERFTFSSSRWMLRICRSNWLPSFRNLCVHSLTYNVGIENILLYFYNWRNHFSSRAHCLDIEPVYNAAIYLWNYVAGLDYQICITKWFTCSFGSFDCVLPKMPIFIVFIQLILCK